MILLLAGTTEGRLLAEALAVISSVIVSKATDYPQALDAERAEVIESPLGKQDLLRLIRGRKVTLVVDATHPYATRISAYAMEVCTSEEIPYLRYEREEPPLPAEPFIEEVEDLEEAAIAAAREAKVILLTTGVSGLSSFVNESRKRGCRLLMRILPRDASKEKCLQEGVPQQDIIEMEGPFTVETNLAQIRRFKIDTIVTKSSGREGGIMEKVEAAHQAGCRLIVIRRPRMDYPAKVSTLADAVAWARKHLGLS